MSVHYAVLACFEHRGYKPVHVFRAGVYICAWVCASNHTAGNCAKLKFRVLLLQNTLRYNSLYIELRSY